VRAETLFERLKGLNRETAAILAEARAAQNNVIALQAVARAEKQLELEARLLGELSDSAKVAVGINVAPTLDLSLLTDEELAQLSKVQKRLFGESRETQPSASPVQEIAEPVAGPDSKDW
jgi:hypothetical protein